MELDSIGGLSHRPAALRNPGGSCRRAGADHRRGEFVLGLFGKAGKTTAFMVVNRDYRQPAEAAVKVALAGGRIQELDRRTGRWTAGKPLSLERTVRIQLGPGDGRLFRVTAKGSRLASPKDTED